MKVDISYYKAGSRKGQVRKNHVVCFMDDRLIPHTDYKTALLGFYLLCCIEEVPCLHYGLFVRKC